MGQTKCKYGRAHEPGMSCLGTNVRGPVVHISVAEWNALLDEYEQLLEACKRALRLAETPASSWDWAKEAERFRAAIAAAEKEGE